MGILAIEDALIEVAKATLGNKVKAVESLPGPWDEETLKRALRLVPGIYVLFAGCAPDRPGGETTIPKWTWVVYVATGHASGEAARRRGDSQQVGAYELLEVLVPRLHGHTVPGHGTLALVRIENLFRADAERQGVTVYAVTLEMVMGFWLEADPATLDPFETFHGYVDIPPHETPPEHRKWLAGDQAESRPEAEDNVSLPQE